MGAGAAGSRASLMSLAASVSPSVKVSVTRSSTDRSDWAQIASKVLSVLASVLPGALQPVEAAWVRAVPGSSSAASQMRWASVLPTCAATQPARHPRKGPGQVRPRSRPPVATVHDPDSPVIFWAVSLKLCVGIKLRTRGNLMTRQATKNHGLSGRRRSGEPSFTMHSACRGKHKPPCQILC